MKYHMTDDLSAALEGATRENLNELCVILETASLYGTGRELGDELSRYLAEIENDKRLYEKRLAEEAPALLEEVKQLSGALEALSREGLDKDETESLVRHARVVIARVEG